MGVLYHYRVWFPYYHLLFWVLKILVNVCWLFPAHSLPCSKFSLLRTVIVCFIPFVDMHTGVVVSSHMNWTHSGVSAQTLKRPMRAGNHNMIKPETSKTHVRRGCGITRFKFNIRLLCTRALQQHNKPNLLMRWALQRSSIKMSK